MMRCFHSGLKARLGLAAAAALAGSTLLGVPAAHAGTGGEHPPAGVVSPTPAAGTPQLNATGTTEQVRQLVPCGGTMYAVGTFTQIKKGSTVYDRNNAFSFSQTAPFTVTSWNPDVNGIVNSIAFNSGCSEAYLGGKFTSVNGTKVTNIAEVSTSTGAVTTGFGHSANGQVETLAMTSSGHLLTGGYFTSVNGSSNKYFVSLNPSTGKDDGYLSLNISGNYGSGATTVYNQQISPDGTRDLAEGTFTSVGGQARRQIFMLSLGGSATVTGWTSTEFNQACVHDESFYVRAASWSPDGNTVYIATTGFHLASTGAKPGGLCDAAAAFPAAQSSQSHIWINYTGCDSLYSTAADSHAAYFGGHERWSMNPNGCNKAGPGSYPAQGMEGVDPANGALYINSAGTAGYYSRGRGEGADDMVVIPGAGLWIASDNAQNTSQCGGVGGHAGICFLPY